MSRRKNLQMVLNSQIPDWVPFAPNFAQWYEHHRKFNILPDELGKTSNYVEAMKVLQCDIFSRNIDGGFSVNDKEDIWRPEKEKTSLGVKTIEILQTPYGDLRHICETQESLTTSHCTEYLIKDWIRSRDAFLWLLEHRTYKWNFDIFCENNHKIGDDGILLVSLGATPLKFLHTYFGLDGTCLFISDHYEEAKAVCNTYWEKLLVVIRAVAKNSNTDAAILMDNVDTPFYPPTYCKDFWTPYVKEAAKIMHKHGKFLFVHACGKLAGLNDVFRQADVDGLEGISAPPLGDWPYMEAKRCHNKFIVVGGFSANEQCFADEKALYDYYERVFQEMKPLDRWIFSSSCQTAIETSWQRIKFVRELVREFGKIR